MFKKINNRQNTLLTISIKDESLSVRTFSLYMKGRNLKALLKYFTEFYLKQLLQNFSAM